MAHLRHGQLRPGHRTCARARHALSTPPERRNTARTSRNISVRYRVVGESVIDDTHDVSEGGLFLRCERPLPLGSRVELFLPGTEAGVEATVVRVVWGGKREGVDIQPGMAVRFEDLDDHGLSIVRSLAMD